MSCVDETATQARRSPRLVEKRRQARRNAAGSLSNLEIVMQALVNRRLTTASAQLNANVLNRSAGHAAEHPTLIQRFLSLLLISLSAMNV
jgi:hypothetical protein